MPIRLCISFIFACTFLSAISQNSPNVVLILADDMGYGDLGIHGNPVIHTPTLNQLARDGMRMDRFYVSPLCAPTRASILTGRYHLSTGVISVSKGLEVMRAEEFTLAELFKVNGYATGIFGKWHNGAHYPNRSIDQGFDEHLGFSAGHLSNYFNPVLEKNGEEINTKGYITDIIADASIRFMKAQQKEGKPFFCYVPFNAPHSPFQLPDAYFKKYTAMGLDDRLASIYGMVEQMDHNIGKILNYLKKAGIEEQTIVIFLSDNGPNGERFNAGMKGVKGSVLEGGIRVPFFIRWPGKIKQMRVSDIPAAHIDLFPTLKNLCALQTAPESKLDGVDLTNVLLGQGAMILPERNIYTHVNQMTVPVVPIPGSILMDGNRYAIDKSGYHLYKVMDTNDGNVNRYQPDLPVVKKMDSLYRDWFANQVSAMDLQRTIVLSEKGVDLPAFEAKVTNGILFREGHAWAHDWISGWHSTSDSIQWNMECIRPGKYTVSMEYQCKPEDVGAEIDISIAGSRKTFRIDKPYSSDSIQGPDRFSRIEAPELKSWGKQLIGTFDIEKGSQQISLRAVQIKGQQVAEFRRLRISFISNPAAGIPEHKN
ncbi:MAG: hypothetical protein RLY85_653 [Bacteroidota bacterium]